jgi:hypothetical protein
MTPEYTYQMALKYTYIHSMALQKIPKLGFLV